MCARRHVSAHSASAASRARKWAAGATRIRSCLRCAFGYDEHRQIDLMQWQHWWWDCSSRQCIDTTAAGYTLNLTSP